MSSEPVPFVDPEELKAANARCEAELRGLGYERISEGTRSMTRSGWNVNMMVRKGPLTDKAIAAYEKRGFYDQDYKDARNRLIHKKSARKGNFLERDGRIIYSPL